MVSIHAPVMGATFSPSLAGIMPQCFYPRPRDGGDASFMAWSSRERSFYPRPRDGGDDLPLIVLHLGLVSIHAPVMGATQSPRD